MSILWILIIAVLGLLTIFLLLVVALAVIVVRYGLVYTPPRFILVILNLLTGELKEVPPGLRPIIPGIHKIIKLVNCQPHVMGVETIKVVSSDSQPCEATFQQTWWVDAFEKERREEGKTLPVEEENTKLKFKDLTLRMLNRTKRQRVELKKGRAIKAATCISDERVKEETEGQAFEKHAEENVRLETKATITSIIGSYDINTIKAQGGYSIYCPECGKEIDKDRDNCPDSECRWGKSTIVISKDFKERLSWLATRILDTSLADRFGIGCETKISNIVSPEPLQQAMLDQQVFEIKQDIAEKRGEAKKRILIKEAEGYQEVIRTGVNANVAYIMGKLSDSLFDFLEHLLKSAIPKESKPKGGETK